MALLLTPSRKCAVSLLLGYREKDGALRASLKETCWICQPGSYGNGVDRAECKKCRGGVICLEGRETKY